MDLLLKFRDFMDAWGIMHSDDNNPEIDEDGLLPCFGVVEALFIRPRFQCDFRATCLHGFAKF